jgi:hypothetical protein
MEPFSALSIATAVVQFIDFTAKLISGTREIYHNDANHHSEDKAQIIVITKDLTRLNDVIQQSRLRQSTLPIDSRDRAILELCERCNEIADKLLEALDRLRLKATSTRQRVWDSFVIALRTIMWDNDKIDALRRDLQDYRQQITMHLIISQR